MEEHFHSPDAVEQHYDVIIAGYGPVGQLLSTLLGRAGHRVAAIERWPMFYPMPRAVHFDHEVARILQNIGLRPDQSPAIEPYDAVYAWRNADRKDLMLVDWSGVGPTGWHTSNFFVQPLLEPELDALAQAQPTVSVQRGWEVVAVEDEPDQPITVVVEGTDGLQRDGRRRTLTARYVIGADGANSFVRSAMGAPMHDLGFFFDWLIVDLVLHDDRVFDPPAWQLCDPVRPTTIVPAGPGRRRWEWMRLPDEDITDLNRLERAWELLEPWDVHPGNATIERHTVYTFQARWGEVWRRGRMMIAGDAAHLMPPFAGQGMCAGLRDAMNLAWKLDLVLQGRAAESVLDTYGPERVPHVRHFIDFSMELGRLICITDPGQAAERDARMRSPPSPVGDCSTTSSAPAACCCPASRSRLTRPADEHSPTWGLPSSLSVREPDRASSSTRRARTRSGSVSSAPMRCSSDRTSPSTGPPAPGTPPPSSWTVSSPRSARPWKPFRAPDLCAGHRGRRARVGALERVCSVVRIVVSPAEARHMIERPIRPEPFPHHDGGSWEPAESRVVRSWPAGSFAENLVIDPAGDIYVTLHTAGLIERYRPADGTAETFTELPAPPCGVAFDPDGSGDLWVTGGNVGQAPGYVWRVSPSGEVQEWVQIPDAVFMNGCTPHPDGDTLLVCESTTGRILAVDLRRPGWAAWITDDVLSPLDNQIPGANGIKQRDGRIWISITDRNLLVRCAVLPDGSAGPLEVAQIDLRADDFAFSRDGALYIATHPANSVLRLGSDGSRRTICGPRAGAVGSTSCAFGRANGDQAALYVTTSGGLLAPFHGEIEEAKLLRLDVAEAGQLIP